jgi:hypothetical protein
MSDQSIPTSNASVATTLTDEQQRTRQLQTFLGAPVPRIFANGIGTAISASDMSIVFLDNGNPAGIVRLSYSAAKSLMMDIGTSIEQFENKTGEKVRDLRELDAKLKAK